jgi:hypothetical protein
MLEFKPTTTIDKLLANNTSAADSFQGLTNNVAKPSAIGTSPFDCPQDIYDHCCEWWQTGPGRSTSHIDVGIQSDSLTYIDRALADEKRRRRKGRDVLWHGKTSFQHKCLITALPRIETAQQKFMITLGSSTPSLKLPPEKYPEVTAAQRTVALIAVMDDLRMFFTSPAYVRNPDTNRPLLKFFGVTGVDWKAVRAKVHTFGADEPEFAFRCETNYSAHPEADWYFAWTSLSQAWIDFAKKFGKPLMLGINAGFNNSLAPWGVKNLPFPKIIEQRGGLRLLEQIAVCKANPQYKMAFVNTRNDNEEGSATESGIRSGKTITIHFDDPLNELAWDDPGQVFDSYTLYVTQNGIDLMFVSDFKGVNTVELSTLDLPNGTWSFLVVANGKNTIQSIKSNLITVHKISDWN